MSSVKLTPYFGQHIKSTAYFISKREHNLHFKEQKQKTSQKAHEHSWAI